MKKYKYYNKEYVNESKGWSLANDFYRHDLSSLTNSARLIGLISILVLVFSSSIYLDIITILVLIFSVSIAMRNAGLKTGFMIGYCEGKDEDFSD